MKLSDVVRSILPTPAPVSLPKILSRSRFSGHSICSMESWKTRIRASTDGLTSKCPTELFWRNGAVDHALTSDAGRVNPRPPPGSSKSFSAPVNGFRTFIVPTDGRSLYDCDEKLSQMLPAMALVAIGLQMFVCISVLGTRSSVER